MVKIVQISSRRNRNRRRRGRKNRSVALLESGLGQLSIAAVPRARVRKGRVNRVRASGMDPFLHCVLGPLSQPGEGMGCPDGATEPSVVIEHRSSYVVQPTPINGQIVLAIVASPYGAVALGAGNTTTTTNTLNSATGAYGNPASQTVSPAGTVLADGASNFQLLPHTESLRSGGTVLDAQTAGLMATKYRVLTTQAKICWTGQTLTDGGSAATGRVALSIDENIRNPVQDVTVTTGAVGGSKLQTRGTLLPQTPPQTFADVSALPGSRVFAAREDVNLINVPTSFDYQDIKEGWSPYTQVGDAPGTAGSRVSWFAGTAQDSSAVPPAMTSEPIPGLGYAPITFYAANGLSTTSGGASITIETRTCVEYTLSFASPSVRFARYSPPERPLALRQVKDIGKVIPSSAPVTPATEQQGWLSSALGWYGNTMKSIIGNVWSAAGDVMQSTRLPAMSQVGSLISAGGQGMLGKPSRRRAITYR